MAIAVFKADYAAVDRLLATTGLPSLRGQIALAIANERERCATVALEQRCERGTPWDHACVAIAKAIRKGDPRRITIRTRERFF